MWLWRMVTVRTGRIFLRIVIKYSASPHWTLLDQVQHQIRPKLIHWFQWGTIPRRALKPATMQVVTDRSVPKCPWIHNPPRADHIGAAIPPRRVRLFVRSAPMG